MIESRDYLHRRLLHIDEAIGLEQVADKTIHESKENEVARILRRGLGISCFVIMEDFIKKRTSECLNNLSKSGIKFSDLPFEMAIASSIAATSILKSRSEEIAKKDKAEAVRLIQDEAKIISSSLGSKYKLSQLSLSPKGSNVNHTEVNSIMKSFGITDGWSVIGSICHKIGSTLPNPNETYRNAAERRNRSAHTANFNYELSLLSQLPDEIRAICLSFDIALTTRCIQAKNNPNSELVSNNLDSGLNFIFLRQTATEFEESTTPSGAKVKSWTSLRKATSELTKKAKNQGKFLIQLNNLKKPVRII